MAQLYESECIPNGIFLIQFLNSFFFGDAIEIEIGEICEGKLYKIPLNILESRSHIKRVKCEDGFFIKSSWPRIHNQCCYTIENAIATIKLYTAACHTMLYVLRLHISPKLCKFY